MFRLAVSTVAVFALLSLVVDNGRAPRLELTGVVTEWRPGELIAVANDQTGPRGVSVVLRDASYHGDPAAIWPGVRVTVHYRSVGERRPVADRVRILED
jgi:hypothetical protein